MQLLQLQYIMRKALNARAAADPLAAGQDAACTALI
jgi:hypothetical protein